jgi:glutaredoxin
MSLQPAALAVIGASSYPECRRTKASLSEQRIAVEWIDLDTIPEATAIVEELNAGSRIVPTVIFADGTHLAEPGNNELADKMDGSCKRIVAAGALVFIALDTNSGFLGETVKRDERGFIASDQQFRTNVEGLFVAGDVRQSSTKQLASAVGEGAAAAIHIRYYLDALFSTRLSTQAAQGR